MTITEWQERVTEWSKLKGWYDPERDIHAAIGLIHSEISEMLEEYRLGFLPGEIRNLHGEPEGVDIELVDAMIRVLDLAGCYEVDLGKYVSIGAHLHPKVDSVLNALGPHASQAILRQGWRKGDVTFAEHVCVLHWVISDAWRKVGVFRHELVLSQIMIALLDFGNHWKINMEQTLLVKMAYNDTRSHRHGNKVI